MNVYEKKATFNERTPVRVQLDWGPVNEYTDENFNTALSDMLSRDNGQVLYVDLESGHVIVELDRCTIGRWESFGFKVNVLNRHLVEYRQVRGITKAEQEAEEKKEAENKALLAMPRETKEVINRLLNQLGEEIDKLRAENEELKKEIAQKLS